MTKLRLAAPVRFAYGSHMGNFVDSAATILSQAQRRVEVSGQNISNMTTPGYKRQISFSTFLENSTPLNSASAGISTTTDFTAGKQVGTDNSRDMAIGGNGFFVVQAEGRLLYTRHGEFLRGPDGRLTTTEGYPLQQAGGGDLVVRTDRFEVLEDGTVVEAGQPVGKVSVVDFENHSVLARAEGGLFSAPEGLAFAVDAPGLRQGMLETSNVSTGDEMITIMEALRRAETGQRLVNGYDDLMGRALSRVWTGLR